MEFLLYVVEYKAELGNSRADPGGWVLGAWGVEGDSKHAHTQTNTQTHKQTHVHTRFCNLGSAPAICMNTATGTDISTKQRQYILRKVQHNIKVLGTMWVYNYIACRENALLTRSQVLRCNAQLWLLLLVDAMLHSWHHGDEHVSRGH